MAFTNYSYLFFLALAALGYRSCRLHARPAVAEAFLLGASLVFYAAWDARYLAVLLGIGVFTYVVGLAAARQREGGTLALAGVSGVVLALVGFKYTSMLVELANLLVPRQSALTVPRILLPLGISFFTFECISYLLDVRRGGTCLVPLRRFLLFPSLFPHMIAGPILRVKEFAPQLATPHRVTGADVVIATDRIVVGLCKKLVLANPLASFADLGFANGAQGNSAVDNWALTAAFSLQIYFDFSAYSDIAIGSGRLLGFKFPENFNLPYHAKSPSDFWNRWHMTLSRWIRDYVAFPLNMKAGRRIWLRYAATLLAMALVGLWHGAGATFVLWGVWHGILMVCYRVLSERKRVIPAVLLPPAMWAGQVVGLLLVCAGWVWFRAPSVAQAARMLRSMFLLRGLTPSYSVNDLLLVVIAGLFYLLVEPRLVRAVTREPEAVDFERATSWLRPLGYAVAFELIFMFDGSNVAFIYFQF